MSSAGFGDSLDLHLSRSVRLHRVLLLLHAVPLALMPLAMEPGAALLMPAAAIGCSWWWCSRHRALGAGPDALVRLLWHADGHWSLWTARGQRIEGELRGESTVAGPVLVLRFGSDSGGPVHTRVLAGDEADARALRRLRARLRIH